MGTPCDVPEPRKIKEKCILKTVDARGCTQTRCTADQCDRQPIGVHLCSSVASFSKFLLPNATIALKFPANNLPMLTTLRIKNLALVADLTLELQPGYNAITGE